jgi:hypothetical protein
MNTTSQEGMVLTNEPGCYFIESEIEAALADPKKARHMVMIDWLIRCVLFVRFEMRFLPTCISQMVPCCFFVSF